MSSSIKGIDYYVMEALRKPRHSNNSRREKKDLQKADDSSVCFVIKHIV